MSHRAAPLFPLARAKLFQIVDYSPRETGGATCEGTARDLILRKRDNSLWNCVEERRERDTQKKTRENKRELQKQKLEHTFGKSVVHVREPSVAPNTSLTRTPCSPTQQLRSK